MNQLRKTIEHVEDNELDPTEEPIPSPEDFPEFYREKENQESSQPSADDAHPPYDVIYAKKKENEIEPPLSKVIGHDAQKKELLAVIGWFKRAAELKARGVSIPRGVILFGRPGNGKSLLMKEITNLLEVPAFIFKGGDLNLPKAIDETFAAARNAGPAVVVIDELDLLIDKDSHVIRALQENLDGVESSDDILVLTATNNLDDIPDALKRNGRLEKLIRIPGPTGEEAVALMKKHFAEFGVALPEDLDEEEVGLSMNGLSCAAVKAVVNDIVLRNGFENITSAMVDASIYNITERIKDAPEKDNLQTAIHESGHAVMASAYPEFFQVNRLNISGASGEFTAKEVERFFWPEQKAIAHIRISMAGILAEKMVFGYGSDGCEEDLQNARRQAYHMFNVGGYSSCWETLPIIGHGSRTETAPKRRRMEKKIERFLRHQEKAVKQYLKAHRQQVETLGKLLYEKKNLKSTQIKTCLGLA